MKMLLEASERLIKATDLGFVRYLDDEMEPSARLSLIHGARGVGKSTLSLQRLKSHSEGFYMSLDHIHFATHGLLETVDILYKSSYRYIVIDEIHKYEGWSRELKNIYDSYPDLYLTITGSSALEILQTEADLSRRMAKYTLYGLSFREFLRFEYGISLSPITIDNLVNNHEELALEYLSKGPMLKYFKVYLQKGYYPYYKEAGKSYNQRLMSMVYKVIETDLPPILKLDYNSVRQLKKLMGLLAQMVPFSPNISKLSSQLGVGRNRVLEFIDVLDRAGILNVLKAAQNSDSALAKPDKIFLENTNLIYGLGAETNLGTMRETFFMNAVNVKNTVSTPAAGDFMVNSKYVFEVGGKNKTYHQISNMPSAYLAKDELEVGYSSTIPLWLFGMLY